MVGLKSNDSLISTNWKQIGMKNKITSTLPFIQATKVTLKNVSKISIVVNKNGKGNTGTRCFSYDYFPTIEYHNKDVKTFSVKRKYVPFIKPTVNIEYSKFIFINFKLMEVLVVWKLMKI